MRSLASSSLSQRDGILCFSSGFLNPVLGAVQFERIPREMVGRVTALSSALCWSLMPLGGVLGGVLVTGIGLDPAMIVLGLAYFVAHPELPRDEPAGGDSRTGAGGRRCVTAPGLRRGRGTCGRAR